MKREAKFTLVFRHWLRTYNTSPAAFELKQTTTDSLPFSAVQEHQIDALLAVCNNEGLLYKIPDDSRGVKPFDMVYLNRANGYVVIKYPDQFSMINVKAFLKEKKASKRKSLTKKRAEEIALVTVKC